MGSIPIPGKFSFFFIPFYVDMTDDVTEEATTTERAPWETDLYLERLGRWQLYNEYKNQTNSNKYIRFVFLLKDIWK